MNDSTYVLYLNILLGNHALLCCERNAFRYLNLGVYLLNR